MLYGPFWKKTENPWGVKKAVVLKKYGPQTSGTIITWERSKTKFSGATLNLLKQSVGGAQQSVI